MTSGAPASSQRGLVKRLLADPLRAAILVGSLWALGALALTVLSLAVDLSRLDGQGLTAPAMLAPALAFASASYLLRFARWHLLARRVAPCLTLRDSFVVGTIGFGLIVTPVRAGEALKLLLLRQRTAVPLATSAPVFLIEKVCEAVALATLALAASPFLPWGGGFQAERRLGLISGALLALGAGIMFRHQVVKLVPRLPLAGTLLKRPRVGRLWLDLVEGGDRLLTWPTIFAALGVSLLARLCDGVVICLVGAVFGIELSLAAGWFMIGSSGFLGGISMVPGGAGVADATLIGLFMAFGGGPAVAIAAALVSRLLILWLWVALGLGLALHCAVGPRSAANEAGA